MFCILIAERWLYLYDTDLKKRPKYRTSHSQA